MFPIKLRQEKVRCRTKYNFNYVSISNEKSIKQKVQVKKSKKEGNKEIEMLGIFFPGHFPASEKLNNLFLCV